MTQVEAQEKASEKAIHKYIYHVTSTEQDLDSHGNVKKTNTAEREDFWVNDAYISKVLSRDGKPLSGGELKKQNEEIDKRIAAARELAQKRAAGTAPPPKRKDEDRHLRALPRARRIHQPTPRPAQRPRHHRRQLLRRPQGQDPQSLEGAIHELAGTVWVDEQDHAMVRIEGHFFNDFKIAGGLLANITKAHRSRSNGPRSTTRSGCRSPHRPRLRAHRAILQPQRRHRPAHLKLPPLHHLIHHPPRRCPGRKSHGCTGPVSH